MTVTIRPEVLANKRQMWLGEVHIISPAFLRWTTFALIIFFILLTPFFMYSRYVVRVTAQGVLINAPFRTTTHVTEKHPLQLSAYLHTSARMASLVSKHQEVELSIPSGALARHKFRGKVEQVCFNQNADPKPVALHARSEEVAYFLVKIGSMDAVPIHELRPLSGQYVNAVVFTNNRTIAQRIWGIKTSDEASPPSKQSTHNSCDTWLNQAKN